MALLRWKVPSEKVNPEAAQQNVGEMMRYLADNSARLDRLEKASERRDEHFNEMMRQIAIMLDRGERR